VSIVLKSRKPPGLSRPVTGLLCLALPITYEKIVIRYYIRQLQYSLYLNNDVSELRDLVVSPLTTYSGRPAFKFQVRLTFSWFFSVPPSKSVGNHSQLVTTASFHVFTFQYSRTILPIDSTQFKTPNSRPIDK
jgi:hypothetical protein